MPWVAVPGHHIPKHFIFSLNCLGCNWLRQLQPALLHDPAGLDVCRQPADRIHLGFGNELLLDILDRARPAVPHNSLGILDLPYSPNLLVEMALTPFSLFFAHIGNEKPPDHVCGSSALLRLGMFQSIPGADARHRAYCFGGTVRARLTAAAPLSTNVFGPREAHVKSSPTWTVSACRVSSHAAPMK